MGLKEDVKKAVASLVGATVAEKIESFDNPNIYPADFFKQTTHFLSLLVGENAAEKSLTPIAKKYKINF